MRTPVGSARPLNRRQYSMGVEGVDGPAKYPRASSLRKYSQNKRNGGTAEQQNGKSCRTAERQNGKSIG